MIPETKLQAIQFTQEQKQEIREMVTAENNALFRRPQCFIGNAILFILISYFMLRGMGVQSVCWPNGTNIIDALGIALAVGIGFFLAKSFKSGLKKSIWPSIFFVMWMFVFFAILSERSQRNYNWPYFLYTLLIFIGWLSSQNAIVKYFCEKLFISKNPSCGRS